MDCVTLEPKRMIIDWAIFEPYIQANEKAWLERLQTLGLIVDKAAHMDRVLEQAFCALVGSKFARVVASSQNTSWLIEHCVALTDAHLELDAQKRGAIKDALAACKRASEKRNELVHAIIAGVALGGDPETVHVIRSARKSHKTAISERTLEDLGSVVGALGSADGALGSAIRDALPDSWGLWQQLPEEDYRREHGS